MLLNTVYFVIAKELPTTMQDQVVLKQNVIFCEYGGGHFYILLICKLSREMAGIEATSEALSLPYMEILTVQ